MAADAARRECVQEVWRGAGFRTRTSLCQNEGKFERDGKWYCGVHNPAKRDERDAKFTARMAANRKAWTRKLLEAKFCEGLTDEQLESGLGRFAAAVERGGWVSVAKELPPSSEFNPTNNSVDVLALHQYAGKQWMTVERIWFREMEHSDITHWRPLPAPPEAAPQVSQLAKEEQQK